MYGLLGQVAQFVGSDRHIECGERLGTLEFAVLAELGDKSRDFRLDTLRHCLTGTAIRVVDKRVRGLVVINDFLGYGIAETIDNLFFIGSAILAVNKLMDSPVVGCSL